MKIRKNDLTVSFSPKNRKYEINYKGFSWVNEGRPPYIIIRHKIGRNYAHTIRTFGCALEKQFSCVDNRITARYSGCLLYTSQWNMEGFKAAEGGYPKNMSFFHIPLPVYSELDSFVQGERAEDSCPSNTDGGLISAMQRLNGTHPVSYTHLSHWQTAIAAW